MRVVLDTNIIVSALISRDNDCRGVLRMAFDGRLQPIIGSVLFAEYELVLTHSYLFQGCPFDADKRNLFLDDLLSVCSWVETHYLWGPNLRDEAENQVLEFALSGGADVIITQNPQGFRIGDLKAMNNLQILHPREFFARSRSDTSWQH